jgi:hypothetical protein
MLTCGPANLNLPYHTTDHPHSRQYSRNSGRRR